MRAEFQSLPGPRKAAIFLASMGAEVSAQIFKSLDEPEIEQLSAEISRLANVDEEVTTLVLNEFLQMSLTKQYITTGGLNYALDVLEKAVGRAKAAEVVGRIQATFQPTRFAAIKKADPNQLSSILRREHPQTIALILANLEPEHGAAILAGLPLETRADVVLRVATIDRTSPEIVKQVESVLEKQMASGLATGVSLVSGPKTVAEVLNRLDPTGQKEILARLDENAPSLAEQIRAMMFTFEDLIGVDDRGLQQIIQSVDQKDLVVSLKAASTELTEKIFRNISERTASIIRQEMDFQGPLRLKDVEDAQRRVIAAARKLEESGQIILTKGGGDQFV
jgi:flagellar motor switch protein FliG